MRLHFYPTRNSRGFFDAWRTPLKQFSVLASALEWLPWRFGFIAHNEADATHKIVSLMTIH
jgi:hypothetical protein